MKRLLQKKAISHYANDDPTDNVRLKRCLSFFDLTTLGIGAIIGAGIFILTGVVAATKAGPAIILSFLIAGITCAFSALSYAELAATIGGCGSAYGYAYVGFGELFAWIIGWDLILEYSISCAAVAIGWSAYFNKIAKAVGIEIPAYFLAGPMDGGIANLPAFFIIIFIAILLSLGVKESTKVNSTVVIIKLLTIALFIALAIPHVNLENWSDFMPFGWKGVMNGASLIFFAYIGFDAVSTTAEEAKNPKRDVPKSILASLIICTIVYIITSGVLTLVAPYTTLNNASPIASALQQIGHTFGARFISVGALAGLTTVILVMFYGASRITFAMSKDGLLPNLFKKVHPKYKTPYRLIMTGGLFIALIATIVPIDKVAELVNIGTLMAFTMVNMGVIALRYTQPKIARPFRTPFGITLPLLGIFFCIYLMAHLPLMTWMRFFIWMAIGLIYYFFSSKATALPREE